MILLLSGEGPTDLGHIKDSEFEIGPLGYLVDDLIKEHTEQKNHAEFSFLENGLVRFVHKHEIDKKSKPVRFAGKKSSIDSYITKHFFRTAVNLSLKAKELDDKALAVLFRDSDKEDWNEVRQSIKDGFAYEEFETGVAMVPQAFSETWVLNSITNQNKHNSKSLEHYTESNSLKDEIKAILSPKGIAYRELRLEPNSITLKSHTDFKEELFAAYDKII